MLWDNGIIEKYHSFAKTYISTYKYKIDCADLAIAVLIDFAKENKLPVKLKYYSGSWNWYVYDSNTDNATKFKDKAMKMLGALNIIDNTKIIPIVMAKPGDLIMTKWSGTLGHTRIIHSVRFDPKIKKYKVDWYQGNLPPVVPEKRTAYFSEIGNVYGNAPRRWNFDQFDK